jgi:hypothetical protein
MKNPLLTMVCSQDASAQSTQTEMFEKLHRRDRHQKKV